MVKTSKPFLLSESVLISDVIDSVSAKSVHIPQGSVLYVLLHKEFGSASCILYLLL